LLICSFTLSVSQYSHRLAVKPFDLNNSGQGHGSIEISSNPNLKRDHPRDSMLSVHSLDTQTAAKDSANRLKILTHTLEGN